MCVKRSEEEQKGANCDESDSFVPFAMGGLIPVCDSSYEEDPCDEEANGLEFLVDSNSVYQKLAGS